MSASSEGIHVDAAAFGRYARALNAGAGTLEKALRDSQAKAARPLAAYVIREGGGKMPAHGGLRAEAQAATAKVKTTTTGVEIDLATRPSIDLAGMDEGILHHLVFGHYEPIAAQHVPEHAWSSAFERKAPSLVLAEGQTAVQARLNIIAREASSA